MCIWNRALILNDTHVVWQTPFLVIQTDIQLENVHVHLHWPDHTGTRAARHTSHLVSQEQLSLLLRTSGLCISDTSHILHQRLAHLSYWVGELILPGPQAPYPEQWVHFGTPEKLHPPKEGNCSVQWRAMGPGKWANVSLLGELQLQWKTLQIRVSQG